MESLNKIAEKVAELQCQVSALCIWWFGWFCWEGQHAKRKKKQQSKCKKYHCFIYNVAANLNTEVEKRKKVIP